MKLLKLGKRDPAKKVYKYLAKKRKSHPLHFTLIDPDKQKPKDAAKLAKQAEKMGTDAIMIGGSQAAQAIFLHDTIKSIKEATKLPVILFPSSHAGISPHADAVFFMSLLNSRSAQYLIEEQMKGSILIKSYGLETLGMAYLIVESGKVTTAEWASDVRALPRDKPELAVGYALSAKYYGMNFVYLEAGSGAKYPVPNDMILMAKQSIANGKKQSNFLIVGGGIRDAKTAREKVKAGADIIVTGTIAEKEPEKLAEIIRAVHGKKK